ncbi:3-keto-5-aminohexanoate cleavage protein [Microbacterium sp. 22303]
MASWAVIHRTLPLGHGVRTGLEDTPVLPNGTLAADNAELVRAATRLR